MNLLFVRRFAKRVLPTNVYSAVKQYGVKPVRRMVGYGRSLFFSLPYAPFRKYQYPPLLAIFLTTRCNLRCFVCRREGFKGESLKFENLYKLKKAIKYARTIDLTGWGEPLLYHRFEDVLKYIYSLNSRENLIQITTNGTRLSEHTGRLLSGHLKKLVISLNAATAETYNRDMKYGNFEETLSAVRAFLSGLEEEDRRKVQLHFVAYTDNFREIPDFVVLANELGISAVSIGHYQISIAEHCQYSLLNVKEEYNAIVDRAQKRGAELGVLVYARRFFAEKERSPQDCMSPFNECFIELNGDIGPCCFCGSYRMGNVYETSFEAVWFGKAYRKLRKRRYLPACQRCVPFTPLDDYRAHFSGHFKEKKEFKEIEQRFRIARKLEAESEQQGSRP